MAGHSFKFQSPALRLEDDALMWSFMKKKRVPKFTAIVHGFMSCTAMLGIAFSAIAYFISDRRNTIARYPEESLRVVISLLVPILWPGLHVLLLENFSEGSVGLLCTAQDVVMIAVLIYFPAISTITLADNKPEGICDSVMIAGLVCAYLVALLHLIQLSARVTSFIKNLVQDPESSYLAKRHILVCLSTCFKSFRLHLNNTNRADTLLHRLNSSNFSDVSFLHKHTWTDDEVLPIFRVKGLSDEERDHIVSVLYKIRNDDVSHAQRIPEGRNYDEKSSAPWKSMRGEKDADIRLWDER